MTYRITKKGSTVRLIKKLSEEKMKDIIWLVEAVTKRGCYICQVAESGLQPLELEDEPQLKDDADQE